MQEDYEIGERDAERIARDQCLKLAADLNHSRMQSLGVERATWRTVRDARVSEDCEALAGVVFDLADGVPPDGVMPGDNHPCCRCYSEPDLSALLGDSGDN
jgi:SPP1 gp7 family putative phage head morphogenesis protein